ncbi:hypothetical protein A4A49_64886, partial [Nicotiana attenuata]
MILVNLIFNYEGAWVTHPEVGYTKNKLHTLSGYDPDLLSYIDIESEFIVELGFLRVQQLIVVGPSGKLYEVNGDVGIRKLTSLLSNEYNVMNLYVVDESDPLIECIPNIVDYSESFQILDEAGTDCTLSEIGSNSSSDAEGCDSEGYDSEELHLLKTQKKKDITENLNDYKEIYKGMAFK